MNTSSTKTSSSTTVKEKTKASESATETSRATPVVKTSPKSIPASKKLSPEKKRKIWFTIFCLAWAVIATYAGQFIVALPMIWLFDDKLEQSGWMLLYYILTYALTLALVLVVPITAVRFCRHQKNTKLSPKSLDRLEKDLTLSKDEMGVNKMPTFVDIGLAPIGYLVYLVIARILIELMSLFSWFQVDQAQEVGFSYFVTNLDRVFAMIAIVLIAPIAEEIIMRGWLYGKLRSRWGIAVSILLTSLLFAVLHGQWNVGVSVFVLSLVMCGLREITGTIWSGMLLHILSNGIAFYMVYIAF